MHSTALQRSSFPSASFPLFFFINYFSFAFFFLNSFSCYLFTNIDRYYDINPQEVGTSGQGKVLPLQKINAIPAINKKSYTICVYAFSPPNPHILPSISSTIPPVRFFPFFPPSLLDRKATNLCWRGKRSAAQEPPSYLFSLCIFLFSPYVMKRGIWFSAQLSFPECLFLSAY